MPGKNGSGNVLGGELEMSNVNATDEMVGMITTQRSYEAVAKVVDGIRRDAADREPAAPLMTTQPFTVGPLPPGVAAPKSTAQRAVYRQALDLEGVFTQHLVDAMMQSATARRRHAGAPARRQYQEMANQQVNSALINGGGLGLAGALYVRTMKGAECA